MEKLDAKKRVTIDLTPGASEEVDKLRKITGKSTADVFRLALSLFKIYVKAVQNNEEILIVSSDKSKPQKQIVLPLEISR